MKFLGSYNPRVARDAWINFYSRTVKIRLSECQENLSFCYSLPFLFLSLSIRFFSLSLLCSPFSFSSSFLFFLSLSTRTTFSCLFHPHLFSFLSILSFLIFFLLSLFLFFFIFSFPLLLASPTRMDQVGETSPHFPPWPLVITMFFFHIFFIFFFPFIISCNTWLNVSHLFQVHHMTLAMCRSLGVPYGIHMLMSCVTQHPVPRKT